MLDPNKTLASFEATDARIAELQAKLSAAEAEVERLTRMLDPRTDELGDVESQARAWCAVYRELKAAGIHSFGGSSQFGRDRAVEFIRHLANFEAADTVIAELRAEREATIRYESIQSAEIDRLREELLSERERADKAESAIETIRDAVLHGRHQLAEMTVDSDVINAVLGIIDDNTPCSSPPNPKTANTVTQ